MVAVNCEQVWQEISNYIEGDVDPTLRTALESHLQGCPRCATVLAGTRNVVGLYGDERLFKVPMGYSWRLQRRLSGNLRAQRGTAFGWVVALAAVALVAGSLAVANAVQRHSGIRAEMSQTGKSVPAELMVWVTTHGKLFHVKGCPFMKESDQPHEVTAAEAIKEGYVPCVRCMGEYVGHVAAKLLDKRVWAGMLLAR